MAKIPTREMWVPAYGAGMTGGGIIDFSTQCYVCKNLRRKPITCRAFPKGIPVEILIGDFDHTKPFKNDKGIMFEKHE